MNRSTPAANATSRFSNRVEDYIKYRPGYPPAMLACLIDEFGISRDHVIADVGSGTGISSEVFLRNGNAVIGVEPNLEMREAGDRLLAKYAGFRSVAAGAEATTLDTGSVDWVVAAQAFHWFDVPRAREEFHRILRKNGRTAIFWNVRREDTPFLADYERLLQQFATDYNQVKHQNAEGDGRIGELFGDEPPAKRVFSNAQHFDFAGLRGRLLSSSYAPAVGQPRHAEMLTALEALFDQYASGGAVEFEYETRLYVSAER